LQNVIGPLALNFPFVSFEESKKRRDSYTFMVDVGAPVAPEQKRTTFTVKLYGYYLDDEILLGDQDVQDIKEELLKQRKFKDHEGMIWSNICITMEPTRLKFKGAEMYTIVTMNFEIVRTCCD